MDTMNSMNSMDSMDNIDTYYWLNQEFDFKCNTCNNSYKTSQNIIIQIIKFVINV